eukprot:CAMPEP_0194062596 /NCGR_PEP_ID=MMETSP0009_2-20130614/77958_1 /TAXON_ID=210454 /ORGANISM="Grammatophora oceanica, Strain CCMP 410" /LENGTH=172 /DNA_ID=CAMNT_0038714385 /DNA_START=1 /DNA_END=519 /DNA_ORIENTATION=+
MTVGPPCVTTLSPFTHPGECTQLNVGNEAERRGMSLPSPFRGLWIRFAGKTQLRAKYESDIVLVISEFLGFNNDDESVIPIDTETLHPSTTYSCLDDTTASTPIQEMYIEFPDESVSRQQLKNLENAIIRRGLLDSTVEGLRVVEMEVAGRLPRRVCYISTAPPLLGQTAFI